MPRNSEQLSLLGVARPPRRKRAHGGTISRGKRKSKRPLSAKLSLHVVLKSDQARGYRSLNNNSKIVKDVIQKASWLFQIKVYSYALNHNHIHLNVRGKRLVDIQNFFRVLAGHIAQQILNRYPLPQKSGNALAPAGAKPTAYRRKFWNDLIYSRLVSWGREFETVSEYIRLNHLEALGLIYRAPEKSTSRDHKSHKKRKYS